ncbi:MAG: hypothetical protein AOA66_0506 [Candidatus Bathyarchaeota archaeon BA2]|nr:MAG: hypothetical protein AOA66_0506 [Candidatus Bathyarchaeota archaeon BA2]
MTKHEGERFLSELERVAENVVISTPSYWYPNIVSENPFQWHRSLWNVEDFRKRGYKVCGAGNFKMINLPIPLRALTSKIPNLFEYLIAEK